MKQLKPAAQITEYAIRYGRQEPFGWTADLNAVLARLAAAQAWGPLLVEREVIPQTVGDWSVVDPENPDDRRFCAALGCTNPRADMLTMLCTWHDVNGEPDAP